MHCIACVYCPSAIQSIINVPLHYTRPIALHCIRTFYRLRCINWILLGKLKRQLKFNNAPRMNRPGDPNFNDMKGMCVINAFIFLGWFDRFFFRSNRWLSLCSLSLSLTLGHVFAVLILACCFCSTSFHSHGRHYRVRLPQLGQSHRRFEFTIRGLVSWKKTSIASHAFIQTMQRIDGQRVLHVFRVIYSFFAVFWYLNWLRTHENSQQHSIKLN